MHLSMHILQQVSKINYTLIVNIKCVFLDNHQINKVFFLIYRNRVNMILTIHIQNELEQFYTKIQIKIVLFIQICRPVLSFNQLPNTGNT